MRKVPMFFELLQGVYGAAKMEREWPTDEHRQVRDATWKTEIDKHSIDELKSAIENAQRQMGLGNRDFSWPNVGLILSGCQTRLNASHALADLSEDYTPLKEEEWDKNVSKIKEMFK